MFCSAGHNELVKDLTLFRFFDNHKNGMVSHAHYETAVYWHKTIPREELDAYVFQMDALVRHRIRMQRNAGPGCTGGS